MPAQVPRAGERLATVAARHEAAAALREAGATLAAHRAAAAELGRSATLAAALATALAAGNVLNHGTRLGRAAGFRLRSLARLQARRGIGLGVGPQQPCPLAQARAWGAPRGAARAAWRGCRRAARARTPLAAFLSAYTDMQAPGRAAGLCLPGLARLLAHRRHMPGLFLYALRVAHANARRSQTRARGTCLCAGHALSGRRHDAAAACGCARGADARAGAAGRRAAGSGERRAAHVPDGARPLAASAQRPKPQP